MKQYLLPALIVFLLLSGCREQRQAKAYSLNSETQRKNDFHNAQMADRKALTPVRLAVVEVSLWTLMGAAVLLIASTGIAGSWYVFGSVGNCLQKQRIIRIPLNPETRQFDFIIYANGRRALNPNTGERLLLSKTSGPDRQLVAGSHAVQLVGADRGKGASNKIIAGIKLLREL